MKNAQLKTRLDSYQQQAKDWAKKVKPLTKASLAVGTTVLAAIPVAEAGIVYSGIQNLDVSWAPGANASAFVNFNGGGNDVRFFGLDSANLPALQMTGQGGGDFDAANGSFSAGYAYPYARSSGQVFGAGDVWQTVPGQTMANSRYTAGNWRTLPNGTTRFVGIRLNDGSCDQFGWIRVTKNNSRSYTIVDWAYETDCNSSIPAGTTVPVELAAFRAQVIGNTSRLVWTTMSEQNNAGFEVQRSMDGRNFQTINFVEGKGTTTEQQDYFYDDRELRRGNTYYYRLRQIDFDGSEAFSDVTTVRLDDDRAGKVIISPNPITDGRARIDYFTEISGEAIVTVFDVSGKVITSLRADINSGSNIINLDVSGLKAGVYAIRMDNGTEKVYDRIIVR